MTQDHQKLRRLLFSAMPENIALALELAKSQGDQGILDLHAQLQQLHSYWKEVGLHKYPADLSGMLSYFEQEGINFFKNYNIKKIPLGQELLIPYIKSFYIWYTSLHTLPKNIGQFMNIEEISIVGGPITSIRKEIWQLPKLKKLKLSIAKNMNWSENVSYAQNLESLELLGTVHPSLPSALPNLAKLNRVKVYAMGSPKDARQLEEWLWECEQIKNLELFGKTILQPDNSHLAQLKQLELLEITRTNWAELPTALQEMKQLRRLRLSKLIKIKKLPDWFADLPLEQVEIYACKLSNAFEILQKIPTLKSLKINVSPQKKRTTENWKAAFGHLLDLEIR